MIKRHMQHHTGFQAHTHRTETDEYTPVYQQLTRFPAISN